jgi:hypothetical protein
LLEEERHLISLTSVTNLANPSSFHGARATTAFAASDHPADAVKFERG